MMKNHVQNLDSIIHLLLRQIAGKFIFYANYLNLVQLTYWFS